MHDMRLTKDEKRAAELRKAVKDISSGTYRKPRSISMLAGMYDTKAQDLADKIQPHITNLKAEIMAELQAVKAPVEVTENMARQLIAAMKRLPEGDRLEVQDIRNFQSFVYGGTKYGVHEMMHGAGSTSSSGGISVIAVTGTINDVNVTFASASEPTLLNINGAFYNTTGGAITWSYVVGVITISSPVGTGGSIFGI